MAFWVKKKDGHEPLRLETLTMLQAAIDSGQVSKDDLVANRLSGPWSPLSKVKGLSFTATEDTLAESAYAEKMDIEPEQKSPQFNIDITDLSPTELRNTGPSPRTSKKTSRDGDKGGDTKVHSKNFERGARLAELVLQIICCVLTIANTLGSLKLMADFDTPEMGLALLLWIIAFAGAMYLFYIISMTTINFMRTNLRLLESIVNATQSIHGVTVSYAERSSTRNEV